MTKDAGRGSAPNLLDTLEAQLHEAQRMDALGRLAAGIAHDFNNVLTVVQSSAETILGTIDDADSVRTEAESILEAARQGSSLASQLVMFAQRETPLARRLDLNDVVRDTARMVRRVLDRRITLDLRLDPAGACVCLNRSQVEQIVMNLLLNARDAMQGVPGSITISTCMRPAATRLRIRDTGAGMTEEIRRRIFEPFFTTKAAAGGTGLGLSTVHAIVATVGGTIEIESTPGAGSVFELRFPPCPEDQPAGRTSDSLRSEPM